VWASQVVPSIHPILDPQSWYLFEVINIAGKQGGVVCETDAGDLQILPED
jgi:hypothetical protein